MVAKHTPGPWTIGTGSIPRSPKDHAVCAGPMIVADVVYSGPTGNPDQSKANARLIAAAPELLEALKQTRHWLNSEAGKLYEHGVDSVTCKVCLRTFLLNEKRNGCRVDHDPNKYCFELVNAIFAGNHAISAATDKAEGR